MIDAFACRIVGWKVSTSATNSFVLDALEQAIHIRRPGPEDGLICHSNRGIQYLAMNGTQRLPEADLVPSVGSVVDSYDNALAETINGLTRPKSSGDSGHGQTPLRGDNKDERHSVN